MIRPAPFWPTKWYRTAALAVLALLPAAGCGGSENLVGVHEHLSNKQAAELRADSPTMTEAERRDMIARLKALVAPWRRVADAQAAGFDVPASPCVAAPEGGMGYHWANGSRIDATVKWDEPEILVFSPRRSGEIGFGAVEYVVPMALSPEAPSLFGVKFIPGGPGNSLWTLHVWLGAANPSGLFAPWNPRVSCD